MALERQGVGLKLGDVQDVLDQAGEPLRGLIDALQVVPLIAGCKL